MSQPISVPADYAQAVKLNLERVLPEITKRDEKNARSNELVAEVRSHEEKIKGQQSSLNPRDRESLLEHMLDKEGLAFLVGEKDAAKLAADEAQKAIGPLLLALSRSLAPAIITEFANRRMEGRRAAAVLESREGLHDGMALRSAPVQAVERFRQASVGRDEAAACRDEALILSQARSILRGELPAGIDPVPTASEQAPAPVPPGIAHNEHLVGFDAVRSAFTRRVKEVVAA